MDRRAFVIGLGAVLAAPLCAEAQVEAACAGKPIALRRATAPAHLKALEAGVCSVVFQIRTVGGPR
jgi:hypothetical protein